MFAYELPSSQNKPFSEKTPLSAISIEKNSFLVYNFHSVYNQQRIFLFLNNSVNFFKKSKQIRFFALNSVSEIFPNANWLEREIAELHGTSFLGKKDLRNLMLQYGDTTAPMLKAFPSVGTREIFYDSVSDLLVQSPTAIQF